MSKGGAEKFIIPLIIGGIVGFFIGYAVNYSSGDKEGKADPVAVAAAADIDIAPLRKLEPTPTKGGKTPKVIVHEISEFQ